MNDLTRTQSSVFMQQNGQFSASECPMTRRCYARNNRGVFFSRCPMRYTNSIGVKFNGPHDNPRNQSGARHAKGGAVTEPLYHDSTRPKIVLLVEDDYAVRDSTMKGLANHGFDVLESASGDEALRLVQNTKETIEVAVIDMAMPLMWGDELARRLSIISPETKFIFI